MNKYRTLQTDWELSESDGLPVSKLTTDLKWKRLTDTFAQLIKNKCGRECRTLDIGGGDGRLHEFLKDISKLYLDIEPSKSLVQQFKFADQKYVFRACGESLPCKNEIFDVVILKASLDHCVDPSEALSESFRVLSPGGKIFILLTNDGAWYKRLFRDYNIKRREGCVDHNYFFSTKDLINMLKSAKFSDVAMYDFDYFRAPIMVENSIMRIIPKKLYFIS